jgi:hypothetical protein
MLTRWAELHGEDVLEAEESSLPAARITSG